MRLQAESSCSGFTHRPERSGKLLLSLRRPLVKSDPMDGLLHWPCHAATTWWPLVRLLGAFKAYDANNHSTLHMAGPQYALNVLSFQASVSRVGVMVEFAVNVDRGWHGVQEVLVRVIRQ